MQIERIKTVQQKQFYPDFQIPWDFPEFFIKREDNSTMIWGFHWDHWKEQFSLIFMFSRYRMNPRLRQKHLKTREKTIIRISVNAKQSRHFYWKCVHKMCVSACECVCLRMGGRRRWSMSTGKGPSTIDVTHLGRRKLTSLTKTFQNPYRWWGGGGGGVRKSGPGQLWTVPNTAQFLIEKRLLQRTQDNVVCDIFLLITLFTSVMSI